MSVSAQSRGTVVFPSVSSLLEDEAFGLRRAFHLVAACGDGVESSGRDDAPTSRGSRSRQENGSENSAGSREAVVGGVSSLLEDEAFGLRRAVHLVAACDIAGQPLTSEKRQRRQRRQSGGRRRWREFLRRLFAGKR